MGKTYEQRVRTYEAEGMTRSDAQGIVDLEDMRASKALAPTHTPGPWELNTQDTGLNDSGTILGAGVVIVPDIYGRSKVESDANARLIAAAPELLEALRDIRERIGDDGSVDRKFDEGELEAMDATIATAEAGRG